jgi:hypothetical protein
LFALCGPAQADLTVSGMGTIAGVAGNYQLIYDTDLNVTWLDYTFSWLDNKLPTSYAGRDGSMLWASELVVTVNGVSYDDWRLPTTVDESHFTRPTFNGTTSTGYNNPATSEMSHLFYTELGNNGYLNIDGSNNGLLSAFDGLQNTGLFLNLISAVYWSGTVNILPSEAIQDNAWFFQHDKRLPGSD